MTHLVESRSHLNWVKESGLSAKEVCALQWGDLLLDDADLERVFVCYRRDDLASYTHNYTFPLSPYGALYVNAWRAYLAESCIAERRQILLTSYRKTDLGSGHSPQVN